MKTFLLLFALLISRAMACTVCPSSTSFSFSVESNEEYYSDWVGDYYYTPAPGTGISSGWFLENDFVLEIGGETFEDTTNDVFVFELEDEGGDWHIDTFVIEMPPDYNVPHDMTFGVTCEELPAAPEPSTALLGAFGILGCLHRKRQY